MSDWADKVQEQREKDRELNDLKEQLKRQSAIDRKAEEKAAGGKTREQQTIFIAYRENKSGDQYKIEGSALTMESAEELARRLLAVAPSRTVLLLQPVARVVAETIFKREAV